MSIPCAIAGSGRMPASGPVIMDIEASGFGAGSYPIEVGIVLADGSSAGWLIRPEARWQRWDSRAEALHGLSRALIEREGWPARRVAQELNRRLAGQTVFTDGWAHDFAWLAVLFDAAELVPRFRLEHLRRLLDDSQARRWRETFERQLQPGGAQHRAAADALRVRATWAELQCPAAA